MAFSVGIIFKHGHEPARFEAKKLAKWFEKKGIEAYAEEMTPVQSGVGEEKAVSSIPTTINWVVVLGMGPFSGLPEG